MSVLDQANVHYEELDGAELNAGHTSPLHAATAVSLLTRDFLAWVGRTPRTYAEAMEAWQTSCPRYPIWENALSDELIRFERGAGTGMGQARVTLTPRGRALLSGK